MTSGAPETITPPCAVMSPIRAAGLPPMRTLLDPFTIMSGGPTHVHISPIRAAGIPEMITVGQHAGIIGPPTCGTSAVTIGHVCISEIRAAGGIDLARDRPLKGTGSPFLLRASTGHRGCDCTVGADARFRAGVRCRHSTRRSTEMGAGKLELNRRSAKSQSEGARSSGRLGRVMERAFQKRPTNSSLRSRLGVKSVALASSACLSDGVSLPGQ